MEKILKTNTNGELNLGNLEYVSLIKTSVKTRFGTIVRAWNLDTHIDQIAFCKSELVYHEADNILLPLPFDWEMNQSSIGQFLNFIKLSESGCSHGAFENVIDKIQIVN